MRALVSKNAKTIAQSLSDVVGEVESMLGSAEARRIVFCCCLCGFKLLE